MAKHRTHTAQPLSPMLVGSFATSLENRIAEMNNMLALQGLTTADPMAICLRNIRAGAKEMGVTFERVVVGTSAPVAAAPVTTTAPASTKASTAPKSTKASAAAPAASTKPRKARAIKEEQLADLQTAGTVSEATPYGCDADGRPLAPYGIKNDGTPMKRRGRVAAASEATPAAPKASTKRAAAPVVEAAAEETAASEESVEEPASGETVVDESGLDDLLSGL